MSSFPEMAAPPTKKNKPTAVLIMGIFCYATVEVFKRVLIESAKEGLLSPRVASLHFILPYRYSMLVRSQWFCWRGWLPREVARSKHSTDIEHDHSLDPRMSTVHRSSLQGSTIRGNQGEDRDRTLGKMKHIGTRIVTKASHRPHQRMSGISPAGANPASPRF